MSDGTTNWKYSETLDHDESIIYPPKPGEDGKAWYNKLKVYQVFVREHLNDTAAYFMELVFDKTKKTTLDFSKVAFYMQFKPFEHIYVDGLLKVIAGKGKVFIDFQFKRKGEEISNPVRRVISSVEYIMATDLKSSFQKELIVPAFNADIFQ